ncbi:MAG: Ig-like domain-containing protein [Actinomycetes bacterium]
MSAQSVDVTKHEQRLELEVVVVDTGGPGPAVGVASVTVGWPLPAGGSPGVGPARLAVGADGTTWRGVVTVPRGVMPGTWGAYVGVIDREGTVFPFGPDALRALGQSPDLTVISHRDRDLPTVVGLRLSRPSVDTRRSARRVTIRVRARDRTSGLGWAQVTAWGGATGRRAVASLALVSGSRQDGTWRGDLVLPRWAGTGPWRLTVRLADRAEHHVTLTSHDLARRGLRHAVAVVSGRDRSPPTLTRIRLLTSSLDVRTADGAVRVSVRATDIGSGVAKVLARLSTGDDGGLGVPLPLRLVSGDRHDGRWAGTIPVARCQSGYRPPSGTRDLPVEVTVFDRARRGGASISQSRVSVAFRDNYPPAASAHRDESGLVHITFNEDLVTANGHWDPLVRPESGSGAELTGTWACSGVDGAPVDCATQAFREAVFAPDQPLLRGVYYLVYVNREHTLSVTDLAGNPARGSAIFRA